MFAGAGLVLEDTRARAERSGLEHRISFPGELNRQQVSALLSDADIFLLVSAWEGLPGSVMEAMAASLPVVGTDVNGINELVLHGETGLLAPAGDSDAIAKALKLLLEDRALRLEMGRKGRIRIEQEFDLKRTTRKLEEFYSRIARPLRS